MARETKGFRFSVEELEMIDWLAKHYQEVNRTDLLRWLVRRDYFELTALKKKVEELEDKLKGVK